MLVLTLARPATKKMSKLNKYIFVLWGDRFEEATAAVFVTELRKAGLLVKVVGLNSRQISGANGLILLPDLTLGKALPLAPYAVCVVIPYSLPDLKSLKTDPRLQKFIALARANTARFVIKLSNGAAVANFDLLSSKQTISYPEDGQKLVGFVRTLARSLTRVGP